MRMMWILIMCVTAKVLLTVGKITLKLSASSGNVWKQAWVGCSWQSNGWIYWPLPYNWSTISCTEFQFSQFPLAFASKNGPVYLCVNNELSPFASIYCCSRKWLLLFVPSPLLELITECLSTLSDTPVNTLHQIFLFFQIFQKFRLNLWPFSETLCSIFPFQRGKIGKTAFFF